MGMYGVEYVCGVCLYGGYMVYVYVCGIICVWMVCSICICFSVCDVVIYLWYVYG